MDNKEDFIKWLNWFHRPPEGEMKSMYHSDTDTLYGWTGTEFMEFESIGAYEEYWKEAHPDD